MTLRIGWGLLVFAGTSWSQQYVISTVAGGAPPPTPVPGLTASIGRPQGTATDTAGNLYFTSLNCVFKLDLNGIVTRLTGTSRAGFAGDSGAATLAQLWNPNGVAVDSAGSVFFADVSTNRVRKILNGIVTTVAGSGAYGFSGDGGPAANAQLRGPNDVAVDRQGNIFIADTGNNRVRKISANGIITTLAGTGTAGYSGDGGPAASAGLSAPQYLAVDGQGNVLISDTGNNRVRKVSTTGVITTLAGTGVAGFSGDSGPAANAQLQNPLGLAVDPAGNVFIADTGNYRVREVSVNGIITTVAGNSSYYYSGDCGPAAGAQLSGPTDLAVDGSGNIFIADSVNNAIRRLQPTSQPTLLCAVADAASEGTGPVSPGKIVVIYGTGLGPSTISVAAPVNGAFGIQLAGTSVSVNGVPAPLIYTQAGQVSAIVPYETTGTSAQVTVSYQGRNSAIAVPVAAAAPSIFTSTGLGFGQAAAVNVADGTLNSANPVATGAYIELFATGEGQTSPAGVNGALAPLVLPLPAPLLQVQATVGGLPATVVYAGAAPGAVAGLMQVDVQIPAGVQPGNQVPVVLQVGTAASSPAVWIAVSGTPPH